MKEALKLSLKIQNELNENMFDWKNYDKNYDQSIYLTNSIKKLKKNFMNDSIKNINATQSTWTGGYEPYLKRLIKIQKETNKPCGIELFRATLESYERNTASRVKCGAVLKRLADQENITLDKNWDKNVGRYVQQKNERLEPPSDELIAEIYTKIDDKSWRWVFGLMATYGLRTHEAFFCSPEDLLNPNNELNTIRVHSNTKTGERIIYPLQPEWVKQFNLIDIQRPNIKTDLDNPNRTMRHISNNVSRKFRMLGLNFVPYALRHAWAIRSIHYKLDVSIAAKMMGHSVMVHTKTYHKYILESDLNKAYLDAIGLS